jgi:UDP-glucose:(heptosyl)LPS alpha-1,3-glucosyltransferase
MQSRLKIALVLERFDPAIGGLESWTDGLARWLGGRGHSVTIVATGGAASGPALRVELVEPSASPLARAASIARRLARLDVDIVHDTGTGAVADVFQPQTGSRLVNSNLDLAALPWRPWLRAWLSADLRAWRREVAALERRQFADPARVIAVSGMVRDQIAARYRIDAVRMTVIHNGVDTAHFDPALIGERRAAARARRSLRGSPVFLLVANNFKLKGVAVAIRAMALLGATLPQAQLVVAGSGDARRHLDLAARLGVAAHVEFLGRVDDMRDAYAAADVAIQPTHYDACSLATLEGLACGLPTITTRTNGAGELIGEGVEGFVLPRSTDAAALANAMARLGDAGLRARMRPAARRLALAHDLAENYARVEAFYARRLALRGTR